MRVEDDGLICCRHMLSALSNRQILVIINSLINCTLPSKGLHFMPLISEFEKIIKSGGFDFNKRAIAREIQSILQQQDAIGTVIINSSRWASDWNLSESEIWAVIDEMIALGFWENMSDMAGETLVCRALSDSSKAIKRANKKKTLNSIKRESSEYRAATMKLADINIESKMMVSDLIGTVDLSERFNLIKQPYSGWLPSDRFAAAGHVFKPDAGILNNIAESYPDISLDLIMVKMYEDLRSNPESRPSLRAFPYWINKWVEKSVEKLRVSSELEDHSSNIDNLLNNY